MQNWSMFTSGGWNFGIWTWRHHWSPHGASAKKTANYKISKSSPLGGQVWRGTNVNCFFFSQAEVMLFLPHLSGSALDMIQKYGHHFYTAPVNTTTTGLPLKGRQFLFSFLFCWYKQHCCVMYPIIITFTQYCVSIQNTELFMQNLIWEALQNILILESHQIRLVWLLSKWEGRIYYIFLNGPRILLNELKSIRWNWYLLQDNKDFEESC